MFSVNRNAMEIVRSIIAKHETLNVGVLKYKNGSTIIDMGINYPGGWMAAQYFAEATLGGLGRLNYSIFNLDDLELPQIEIYADRPAIACLSCQLSGWALPEVRNEAGIVPLISGPVRTVAREDSFAKEFAYQDSNHEVVVALQDNRMPEESLINYIAKTCKVNSQNIYVLVAPTGSIVGCVNVVARTLETSLWRLHHLGMDVNKIAAAWGRAPLPPITKDEYTAMIRTNTYTYYGGTAGFIVECEDNEIEKILHDIPLSPQTTQHYGVSFGELLKEANGNIFEIKDFVHNVTKVIFYNVRTGRTFRIGKIDFEMLKKCI
ncbi:MAG: methenyltetrahydromethanopterin cyclohydrolase [Bacillota bacterium]